MLVQLIGNNHSWKMPAVDTIDWQTIKKMYLQHLNMSSIIYFMSEVPIERPIHLGMPEGHPGCYALKEPKILSERMNGRPIQFQSPIARSSHQWRYTMQMGTSTLVVLAAVNGDCCEETARSILHRVFKTSLLAVLALSQVMYQDCDILATANWLWWSQMSPFKVD